MDPELPIERPPMRTLGRSGVPISAVGLGTGGNSRAGMATGGDPSRAVEFIRHAVDIGVNYIDTAPAYGTEEVVGRALRGHTRAEVVLSTKVKLSRGSRSYSPGEVVAQLDESLRRLATDHVDVVFFHGLLPHEYERARDHVVPVLMNEQAKGKFRFMGVTESGPKDPLHHMLALAVEDDVWDVIMVAYSILHQGARHRILPAAKKCGIGVIGMFAVRRILRDLVQLRAALADLVRDGTIPEATADEIETVFLEYSHAGTSPSALAYAFAAREERIDSVLTGTGSAGHLHDNVRAVANVDLTSETLARLHALFGQLPSGIGIELPRPGATEA